MIAKLAFVTYCSSSNPVNSVRDAGSTLVSFTTGAANEPKQSSGKFSRSTFMNEEETTDQKIFTKAFIELGPILNPV